MGMATPRYFEQRLATSPIHFEFESARADEVVEQAVLEPTPAGDLARVREILKPTVLELANLFGVSRQAVYDWQSGSQPSAEAAQRLATLARAADVFCAAGVIVDSKTLRRKVAGGGTLLDAILGGGDAVQVAKSLVQTLQRESGQRTALAKRLAGRTSTAQDLTVYGSPVLEERV
jgi:transcriptional regulator with XRE-family HTH domain